MSLRNLVMHIFIFLYTIYNKSIKLFCDYKRLVLFYCMPIISGHYALVGLRIWTASSSGSENLDASCDVRRVSYL
ncbi:hypothetical protein [Leptospira sp. GIMC2001]|uniref:hypothetical protein n=1 Tax=Leptospira sp. GIMC2001 TaxID=1513297 RepID=UPI00234AD429|nr:hypothetical protein [Leptospira sp. GIMC2001]WCL47733.1 hypothetical protein O4O04_00315 [Leptospira sp. GIMC2001]